MFKPLDRVWVVGSEAEGLIEWDSEAIQVHGDIIYYLVVLENPEALWPYRCAHRLLRENMLRLID